MNDDLLTLQLDSIVKAQQRARQAFFFSLVASCIVFLCVFNITFSQDRPPEEANYVNHREEYKLRVKAYVDRWYYSVPFLGISLSLEDLSLFGPLALFVFSFYYVSCSRNTVLQLTTLSSRKSWTQEEHDKAYVAITGEVVLNTSVRDFTLIPGLGPIVAKWSLQGFNVYRALLFAPFFSSIAAFACDFFYSFIRRTTFPNRSVESNFFESLDRPSFKINVVLSESVALCLCLVVLAYCLAAVAYSRRSEILVNQINTSEHLM